MERQASWGHPKWGNRSARGGTFAQEEGNILKIRQRQEKRRLSLCKSLLMGKKTLKAMRERSEIHHAGRDGPPVEITEGGLQLPWTEH